MQIKLPHNHDKNMGKVLEDMPCAGCFLDAASLFAQMGEGSRLRIFWLLCHCEECVNNIAAAVCMSAASVSHHLKVLKLNGLIVSRRRGKEIYYTLADNRRAAYAHKVIEDYFDMKCPTECE